MRERVGSSPTVDTLVALVAVFVLQGLLLTVAPALAVALFVLQPPLDAGVWTLATSVYAHDGLGHLLANAIGLLLFGPIVERRTTRGRFHAFFLGAGVLSGAAQVAAYSAVGAAIAVVGASGAVFGLLGYVLASNPLSERTFGRLELSGGAQLLVFLVVAAAITWYTAAPGVALVGHFTGLLLGLVAGRAHLLRP